MNKWNVSHDSTLSNSERTKMQKEILENGRARKKKFNESQQLAVWKRRAELNPTEPVNINATFKWQKNTFDKTYKMQVPVWTSPPSGDWKTVRSKTRSIKWSASKSQHLCVWKEQEHRRLREANHDDPLRIVSYHYSISPPPKAQLCFVCIFNNFQYGLRLQHLLETKETNSTIMSTST